LSRRRARRAGAVSGAKFPRLRLENHHAAGHAQLERTLAQPRQDSLVATVNTVKVANSGDAAPMLGAQVVETSNQLHNALLAHKVVDYNHTRRRRQATAQAKVSSRQNAGFIAANLAQRLAIEIPQTETEQQQHPEIRHHTGHHQHPRRRKRSSICPDPRPA
jgi:hypothetical protein